MRKKQPDYKGFAVALPSQQPAAPEPASEVPTTPARRARAAAPAPSGATLRERSKQLLTYVSPEFHRQLRIYAAEAGIKPHDLVIEALEMYAKAKGIKGPVRV